MMTTDPPTSGSPWAKFCPDAYPVIWFDAIGLTALPAGFARFATDDEAALIVGQITPDEFAQRTQRTQPTPSGTLPAQRHRRPSNRAAVSERFRDLSTFLRTVHAKLTPTQRAIWLSVFVFSQGGQATVTQATLARIAGVTIRAVQKATPGLIRAGLLELLEKGKPGRSSVYRYRVQSSG
jgi:hypothetical protein